MKIKTKPLSPEKALALQKPLRKKPKSLILFGGRSFGCFLNWNWFPPVSPIPKNEWNRLKALALC